ncbi:1,4-alpha-glucan branching enzyme [Pilibacter termitis]|uniref:1,4-alpha-glucan branching enzyme n=1 Tax=Pilibacter termitis TaxID=263852 RepID=A0A1T4NR02_9ENTE|nr:alpha amylase C-terminal domain-containing protein [Pilibacter termitis]SJZ81634.1 1,4-alpha-glucan branching enzyme [Pilibacter termitis]
MEKNNIETLEDEERQRAIDFFKGDCVDSWKYFAHHEKQINGKKGYVFRVWAPNAQQVYLAGDFTKWWEEEIPMQRVEGFGIWEVWTDLPREGELYKFKVRQVNGVEEMKIDPFALRFEKSPGLACVVGCNREKDWTDMDYLSLNLYAEKRHSAMNIYYLNIKEWRKNATFQTLKEELVPYLKEMHYTHVLFRSLMEYNEQAESPESVLGFFALEESSGTILEFQDFVESCHLNGIGVFVDMNISQFSMESGALSYYDGTPQFEYLDRNRARAFSDNRKNFDLGKGAVQSFLLSSVMYWIETFHLDGVRLPFVTKMITRDMDGGPWSPNHEGGRKNFEGVEFLIKLNEMLKLHTPHVEMFGDELTARMKTTALLSHGGLGFTGKINQKWSRNLLKFYQIDPIYRKYHFNLLVELFEEMYDESFVNPLMNVFEEKGERKTLATAIWGREDWKKFSQIRNFLVFHKAYPAKNLQEAGVEFASIPQEDCLNWSALTEKKSNELQEFTKQLNQLYLQSPALWELDGTLDGFDMVDNHNRDQSILSFIRKGKKPDDFILVILNMTPVEHPEFHIGVTHWGEYEEILNSEMKEFGGSWTSGNENLHTLPWEFQELPFQLHLSLPAFGAILIRPKKIFLEPPEEVLEMKQDREKANQYVETLKGSLEQTFE